MEKMVRTFCARSDVKETSYEDMILTLASRQTVSQDSVVAFARRARGGKILTKMKDLVGQLRKKACVEKLKECAALLEELCITDDSYHKLRTKMELQNELPTLYKIRQNRCALNDELMLDLNIREVTGGASHTRANPLCACQRREPCQRRDPAHGCHRSN